MKNNKRRLLKHLPFDNLEPGDVIWRGGRGHGGDFSVSRPTTFYDTLRFKPIDIEEAEELMKGLIHILPKLSEKGWVWSKFSDITTGIKNN